MDRESMYGIVLRIWPDEPVYHKPHPDDIWQTKCGRKIGPYVPYLPRKHVAKFARPCKDCARG